MLQEPEQKRVGQKFHWHRRFHNPALKERGQNSLMQIPFPGGRACGAIRYECAAEPLGMHNCHCRDCQSASGGFFGGTGGARRGVQTVARVTALLFGAALVVAIIVVVIQRLNGTKQTVLFAVWTGREVQVGGNSGRSGGAEGQAP